jgi:hypothetical protein
MTANIMRPIFAALFAAILPAGLLPSGARGAEVTQAEARAIAKEAYIYGYPMVEGYRTEYAYFVDRQDPQFKAPWNQIYKSLF